MKNMRVKRLFLKDLENVRSSRVQQPGSTESLKHDPHFWETTLQNFDLSQCYSTHENAHHDEQAKGQLRLQLGSDYDDLWISNRGTEQTRLLYEYYDLTDARINRLFTKFDKDTSGNLSIDEFIVAMAHHGILANPIENKESEPTLTRQTSRNLISHINEKNAVEEIVGRPDPAKVPVDPGSKHAHDFDDPNFKIELFEKLLDAIDSDKDGCVDQTEFIMCVQGLKLSMLTNEAMNAETRKVLKSDKDGHTKTNVALIDYCQSTVNFNEYPLSKDGIQRLLFGVRPNVYDMTWISVSPAHENRICGVDPVTVLQLAVKCRLHPLAIHDAMKIGEQRPKVDEYGGEFIFVILPAIRLTKRSIDEWKVMSTEKATKVNKKEEQRYRESLRKGEGLEDYFDDNGIHVDDADMYGDEPLNVQVEVQQVGIFVKGKQPFDTVISIEEGWHAFHVHYEQPSSSNFAGLQKTQQTNRRAGIFTSIVGDLADEFSFQRQGNSLTLLYTMINKCMAEIEAVTSAYRSRLGWFQVMLQVQEWQLERKYIRRLLSTQRELEKLTQLIRPCSTVLRHLITFLDSPKLESMVSEQRTEIKTYLEDSSDQLGVMIEDLGELSTLCKSYYIEYDTYQDQRMNRVLYWLTLVTTIFVPLQTMTGLYGMNFVDENGAPAMPELTWGRYYGYYLFFWGSVGVLTISLVFAMIYKGIVGTFTWRRCCKRSCPQFCQSLLDCILCRCCRCNCCRRRRARRNMVLQASQRDQNQRKPDGRSASRYGAAKVQSKLDREYRNNSS